MIEGNNAIRVTDPDFLGKTWFIQKWGESATNAPMDPFAINSKLWHYFFLQMLLNCKAICLLTFGENRMAGKNLFFLDMGQNGGAPPLWYLDFFSKIFFIFFILDYLFLFHFFFILGLAPHVHHLRLFLFCLLSYFSSSSKA